MRYIDPSAGNTCDPVKHPYGDVQKSVHPAPGEIAPKNCIAGLVDHLKNMNQSTKLRMPSIKNLAPVGNVGVLAFSC